MIITTYETNGKVFEQQFTGKGGDKKATNFIKELYASHKKNPFFYLYFEVKKLENIKEDWKLFKKLSKAKRYQLEYDLGRLIAERMEYLEILGLTENDIPYMKVEILRK